jgi:hypothetical protein
MKEVAKQGDSGEDSKKGLTKVNEHRKVKKYVRSQMVPRNAKVLKKSVEEGRRWKAKPLRMKEMNKTISPGPGEGTRCSPSVFHSVKPWS